MDHSEELERLAKAYSLTFKNLGNGHLQIEGHGAQVNYWPNSKNRTAHVKGGESTKHCAPWDVVRLCLQSGKQGLSPKKKNITKNKPQMDLKPVRTNPAGIKNFYKGLIPPWEFPTMIGCHSDNLRVKALHINQEADRQDQLEQE